jgi:hypothetical protein
MTNTYSQFYWDDLTEGQDVSPITLPATYSMVLLSAIATMDFFSPVITIRNMQGGRAKRGFTSTR